MPSVSVIVPVYKVEDYLERCLDSILSQTFSDFELILVDDGSPDHCGMICDEYKEKDQCVKVIHNENGALSDAGNKGIDIAHGDYLSFVDSDDKHNMYTVNKLSDCVCYHLSVAKGYLQAHYPTIYYLIMNNQYRKLMETGMYSEFVNQIILGTMKKNTLFRKRNLVLEVQYN